MVKKSSVTKGHSLSKTFGEVTTELRSQTPVGAKWDTIGKTSWPKKMANAEFLRLEPIWPHTVTRLLNSASR